MRLCEYSIRDYYGVSNIFYYFFRLDIATTTSLFLTLNIQISHHLQIARLIEAGGV